MVNPSRRELDYFVLKIDLISHSAPCIITNAKSTNDVGTS